VVVLNQDCQTNLATRFFKIKEAAAANISCPLSYFDFFGVGNCSFRFLSERHSRSAWRGPNSFGVGHYCLNSHSHARPSILSEVISWRGLIRFDAQSNFLFPHCLNVRNSMVLSMKKLIFTFTEETIRALKVGDEVLTSGVVFIGRGTRELPTGGFRV